MGETEDKFRALDGLDELFPFFRCPGCRDRDHQSLVYTLVASCPVRIDNPTKTFEGDYVNQELAEPKDAYIHCDNCGNDSPLPDNWTWRIG